MIFDYKDKIEDNKDVETDDITLREGLTVQVTYYEKLTKQTKVELGFIKYIFDDLIIVESLERKGKLFHLKEEYIYNDYIELVNYTYSENKNITAVIMTKLGLPVEIMDEYLLGRPRQVEDPKSRGFYIPPIDDMSIDQNTEENVKKRPNLSLLLFGILILAACIYTALSKFS